MDGIREILPSYLDAATQEEKRIFFEALIAVAGADGNFDNDELKIITKAAG